MTDKIVQYYNDLANDYDISRFSNSYGAYIDIQEKKVLKKYLNKNKGKLNLDLACGTGRFLEYGDYGIDVSNKMVEIAKGKYPQKNISVGNAESLPYANSFFENVICFHLFMHLDLNKFQNILEEVYRVTKKGGCFIFDFPSEKRRKITNYKSNSWHGGNQISLKKLKTITNSMWKLISFHGIAFFPIHRIPFKLRKYFIKTDNFLGNSFLKEYSSHLIFVLRKR